MISDNGTNFVGAVTELKELVGQLDKDKIQRASHFGGAHEVMVKAAKRAIYAFLSSSDVTDEELVTVVTGAESLLYFRPLAYQSANIKDWQMGGQFAPESVNNRRFSPRKKCHKVQELISRVWSRWLREYLPMLNTRPKWTDVIKDLNKGDIGLVLEPNLS